MSILVVDNYDSFTYNLVQLVASASGEQPIVIANDAIEGRALDSLSYDAVILSPGPGRPERDRDFGICRQLVERSNAPVLGVCLGHQGIGHIFGARVVLAPEPMHGRVSHIYHDGTGLFRGVPSPFLAVRYHSLVVEAPAYPLQIDARTPDGLVMALSHRSLPFWGVQFHPESISTCYGEALIANFLRLAQASRSVREVASVSCPVDREQPRTRMRLSAREIAFRLPQDCYNRLYRESTHSFWLDSSSAGIGQGRYSYMGDADGPNARLVSYNIDTKTLRIDRASGTEEHRLSLFDYLETEEMQLSVEPCLEYECPFKGGYVGYFGYELKAECGGDSAHSSQHDDGTFLFADRFLAFDIIERRLWLVCLGSLDAEEDAGHWFDEIEQVLSIGSPELAIDKFDSAPWSSATFEPRHSRAKYLELIKIALGEITNGETYEVCLTNEWASTFSGDALALYFALREANPAPFSAFFSFGALKILSCSPECLINISAEGLALSKPIKGTINRGDTPEADMALSLKLRASEKDRAENLMIVDLVRNDLNRVCKSGSVRVPKLYDIESFKTVHQMVSTVQGELADHVSRLQVIKSLFPGGSMTGAPKIRTMEIIDKLEAGPRGVYSGALGYLSLDGAVQLSIVIRTLVIKNDRLSLGAGGAIVSLSDPIGEYEETLIKSEVLMHTARNQSSGQMPAKIGAAVETRRICEHE